VVNEALAFLTETALPAFERLMEDLGPIFTDILDNYVRPLFDSFSELFAIFDTGDESINLLTIALAPLKLALEAIKFVIDAIVAGLKIIGVGGGLKTQKLDAAAEAAGYGGGSYVNPMNRSGGTSNSITTNTNLYLDGRVVAQSTNNYLGNQTRNTSPQRSYPRNP